MVKTSKKMFVKVIGIVCLLSLLISALYVPMSFGANAAVLPVTDDETIVFSFEPDQGSVTGLSDANNLTRGDDGMGCASWGLGIKEEADGNMLGFKHTNPVDWADPGGYRLNNKDGVYMLDTSSTYVVSFKLRVMSTSLNTSSLTAQMTSYLRLGYGFTGATSGNTVSKMHVVVSDVFSAASVPQADKAKGTFNLTTAAGSSIKTVGNDWYELTYVFTTPESFGDYSPALGFYAANFYGVHYSVDDVAVTKLGSNKGAVVLVDEYYGTATAVTGEIGSAVELPKLEGTDASHEFLGWYSDADRTNKVEALNFAKQTNTVYTAWKAPVTVTFVDTLNGTKTERTGIAGETINYPANPVDNVNEPDQQWFMGWYTSEACTEPYTTTTFGYTNYSVYSKWLGEIPVQVQDFENYTKDKRGSTMNDSNVGTIYTNAFYFGTALHKIDDPTNSSKGKVISFDWDSTMVKTDSPDTYDAAGRYGTVDHMFQMEGINLADNTTYTVTFDYYVENIADNHSVIILPMAAHNSGVWSTNTNFKNTQAAYFTVTDADKDGQWHKGEMTFTMKYPAATSNVLHILFNMKENKDAVIYVDNFTFTAVQPYESAVIYVENNGKPNTVVKDAVGATLPKYVPQNNGLAFGGWYTDSNLKTPFTSDKFPFGSIVLYGAWKGYIEEFDSYKTGSVITHGTSMLESKEVGYEDNYSLMWHFDGDVPWEDDSKTPMYKRGSIKDHIAVFRNLEDGKTYEISYYIRVDKASSNFNVEFITGNPGSIWDDGVLQYGSTFKNIDVDGLVGNGWVKKSVMLTFNAPKENRAGLYISITVDNPTIDGEIIAYIDRVSVIPVETAVVFDPNATKTEGAYQTGNAGDKINFPTLKNGKAELLGWYLDKECTNEFTGTVMEDGIINLYAKWAAAPETFENYKYKSTDTMVFGPTLSIINETGRGYGDDYVLNFDYHGGDVFSVDKKTGAITYNSDRAGNIDHMARFGNLKDGTVYKISFWYKLNPDSKNGATVGILTGHEGTIWDTKSNKNYGYSLHIPVGTDGWQYAETTICTEFPTDKGTMIYFIFNSDCEKKDYTAYTNLDIDDVMIEELAGPYVYFNGQNSKDFALVEGKVGDAIAYPANPVKVGYNFKGWFLDKEATIPFDKKVFEEGDKVVAFAGYSKASYVVYDFETYNFSNPVGYFVWDEGATVAQGRAASGKQAIKFDRNDEATHNGRAGFALVGHDKEHFVVDRARKYIVTFKYFVAKNGDKDAKISFTTAHATSYWHNGKGVTTTLTVPISTKTGVWHTGALVIDGSLVSEVERCDALFAVLSGGPAGLYYIDDIAITTLPLGYNAYTVDNGGCNSVPKYVSGPIGSNFMGKLPKEPKLDNHVFKGYTYYDENGNLKELKEEEAIIAKETKRIIANFVRIETVQNFDDGFEALLRTHGDYTTLDFDWRLYDSEAEGASKDNVTSGTRSLHRKGETYYFESAQVLTADKSLTVGEKYTIKMKVKTGKCLQTDGAIKMGSCRTPYYPWSITGDYHAIAAITDIADGNWHEIEFTFVAVEAFLSFHTPGYVELFIDDINITLADASTSISKSVSFTEYVPAKRDKDGNLVDAPAWNATVDSVIDASLGKGGFNLLPIVIIGGGAVLLIAAALVVILLVVKKRKKAKNI